MRAVKAFLIYEVKGNYRIKFYAMALPYVIATLKLSTILPLFLGFLELWPFPFSANKNKIKRKHTPNCNKSKN